VLVPAVTFPDVILAIHILGAVVGFGAVFAYPLLFSAAAAMDPSVTPWLLRTRKRVGRLLVNPGLTVVVLAGIYLATDEHQWKCFYVQWGLGAAIVIGAIEGAIVIPRCGRLADLAERDLAGAAVAAGGQRTSATWSRDYAAGYRAVWLGSALMELIVVITVVVMAAHSGA
jgi:hypothetical protein